MSNEYRIIKFGGYDWRVLSEQDEKMLIISDKVIDYQKYHLPKGDDYKVKISWDKCYLREYLNTEFYNKFDDKEKSRIIKTTLKNGSNPWYADKTQSCADTEDYIFLISIEEMAEYFGKSDDYIKRNGYHWGGGDMHDMVVNPKTKVLPQFLYDKYNDARMTTNLGGNETFWRLRSPGRAHWATAVVNPIGAVIMSGTPHSENGMRPAMWITV